MQTHHCDLQRFLCWKSKTHTPSIHYCRDDGVCLLVWNQLPLHESSETAALRRPDPFRTHQCRFREDSCIVEGSKDCSSMGCIYEVTCASCQVPIDKDLKETRDPGGTSKYNYVGMTMCSVHSRMKDHLKSQKAKASHSPMWRHDLEHHDGEHQTYQTRILTRERSIFPLALTEGLYIEKQYPGTSLNDRNERGRGSLVRIRAERVS